MTIKEIERVLFQEQELKLTEEKRKQDRSSCYPYNNYIHFEEHL